MEPDELTGYYTYRSFLNRPSPVDDFNEIKFAEAEVFLVISHDGTVGGTLAFPAAVAAHAKSFLDLSGRVVGWNPIRLRFTGRGRVDTDVSDYLYDYEGEVAPQMPQGVQQRLALCGTVVRSRDHGTGSEIARAGATASFVAVKRDFTEARDTPGFGLISPAIDMLASRLHRLHHTVWHMLRGTWWDPLNDADRTAVAQLHWNIERPPFTKSNVLDVSNGAGEDFLFMHRRMIAMVHGIYRKAGVAPPQGWKKLPGGNTPQFSYVATSDANAPGAKIYTYDPAGSGVMVPPATTEYLNQFPEAQRTSLRYLKTPEFLSAVMGPQEQLIRRQPFLASLSLGALGNIIEFTIHNQMHMRWTAPPRDPSTGGVVARLDFDFDLKWDDRRNDYLGDFHSSHVSPVFWRLHGWVDDRIEDWYRAQEAVRPGVVKRRAHKDVDWFEKGDWVATDDPFDQPRWWNDHDHHRHGGHTANDERKIDEMLKVMDIIRSATERSVFPSVALEARLFPQRRFTSFADRLFLAS